MVPALKLRQVDIAASGDGPEEILGAYRLGVKSLEVKIHRPAPACFAEHRVEHTDHFRTLFIDGRRVEVVDLDIFFRLDRVRGRRSVFDKLAFAQRLDVTDALRRGFIHIGAETLVAKDGQSLFECQLEPVATGDTVLV